MWARPAWEPPLVGLTIIRPVIRPATTADAPAIAAIYNQGIAERQATFETERRRPGDLQSDLLLVAERDRRVVGWAAVAAYSDRCVYAGVGEYTIYVDRGARGAGLGRELLEALAGAARDAGYYKLSASSSRPTRRASRWPGAAAFARSACTSATAASTASGATC